MRDMQGLPDNRLRLLLDEVRPQSFDTGSAASLPSAPALQGKLAWTWESPVQHAALAPPLPGQTVCLTRRPMPAQGFANEGQTDWGL